jgi:uncharacterized protein YneF (UPF0154 family)
MNNAFKSVSIQIQLLLSRKGSAWVLMVVGVSFVIIGLVIEIFLSHGDQKNMLAENQLLKNNIQSLRLALAKGEAPSDKKIEITQLFQSKKVVERDLNRIFEIAFKNQIDLQVGDYKWILDKSTNISKYQITYPVAAEYSNIERFIVQVMLELPWVSLDSFSIRRESVKDDDVQVDIVFTLHFDSLASPEVN